MAAPSLQLTLTSVWINLQGLFCFIFKILQVFLKDRMGGKGVSRNHVCSPLVRPCSGLSKNGHHSLIYLSAYDSGVALFEKD